MLLRWVRWRLGSDPSAVGLAGDKWQKATAARQSVLGGSDFWRRKAEKFHRKCGRLGEQGSGGRTGPLASELVIYANISAHFGARCLPVSICLLVYGYSYIRDLCAQWCMEKLRESTNDGQQVQMSVVFATALWGFFFFHVEQRLEQMWAFVLGVCDKQG